MRFSSLFVLSSIIASGLALPLINFVPVLDDVRHKVGELTAQIDAFPSRGGTFDEAIKIHGSGVLLRASLGQYTRDLYHYPMFNEADSRANMKAAKKLESTSEASLHAIIAKKAAFKNVSGERDVLAIIVQDVEAAASATEAFNDMLIERTDPSYVPEAKALRDRLARKFRSTVTALKKK
ncbi:hypothetical protein C0993_002526 [Termitomyces sp. T159_Od127]|nr:hypothetical protein C0993_002526 [Termitomyces sp. T159_Od127]